MKLIKLEANNLATYDRINIDFTKLQYPTFVEGRTGAGKTTLFVDAITAALYGAAYGHKRLLREIVMKGKQSSRISLTFEVNGELYQVERIIYSTPGQTGVVRVYHIDKENNVKKPLSYTTKESERLIEHIIGLTYEALTASTIVRQGDVYGFLDAKPAERRDLIIEMLRLGVFEKLRERAKNIRDAKEREKRLLEGEITQLNAIVEGLPEKEKELEILREKLPQLESELREEEKLVEKLESELGEKQSLKMELMGQIGELRAKQSELEEKQKQREDVEKELRELEEELKLVPTSALNELDELSESVFRAETIMKDIAILEREIREIKEYIREKEQVNMFKELSERLKKKLEELEQLVADLDKLKDERSQLIAIRDHTKEHLKALREGEGVCPVCGRPLDEELKSKREGELLKKIENLEAKISELDKSITKKEEIKKLLEEKKGKYREYKAKIEQKEGDLRLRKVKAEDLERKEDERLKLLNEHNAILQKLQSLLYTSDIEEAKKKIKSLQETKKKIDRAEILRRELQNLNERINNLKQEIETSKNLLMEKERLDEAINKLQQEIKKERERVKEINTKLTELKSKISHLEEEIENLKRKREELEEKKRKFNELEEDIKSLGILIDRVFSPSELPTKLLEDYLKVIEDLTNQYLEAFGQDIRIRFKLEKRGEKSQIQIKTYHQSYERDPNTFSGGERTLIGFSLRLAIGKLISRIQTSNIKPKFLIVDEGFGPLDEELRIKVADALTTLLELGEYEQIIVISHHRELRESPMFKTIIKIEKRDGKSILEIA